MRQLANGLRRFLVTWLQATSLAVQYPFALVGSCIAACLPSVRHVAEGSDPNADSARYAVYANYDRRSLVADYVLAQVEALARIGCRVIFVSTSPRLSQAQIARLAPHCRTILHRWNLGHDFGSYKAGIQQIDRLQDADALILMNDSCYGPLFDLADIERQAGESEADIWGVTDSWWKSYHLQSYFMHLNRRALASEAFHRFWRTLLPYQSRDLVIRNGEVRLTQHLVRSGLRSGVLCPYQAVAAKALELILARLSDGDGLLPSEQHYLERLADAISNGATLNPMHPFWDVLIVEYGCPFIKRNLLRSNPAGIRGIIDWPTLLAAYTDYDVELIERHLRIK